MVNKFLIFLTLVFVSCVTSKSLEYRAPQSVHYGDCEIGGSIIDTCLIFDGSENLPQWNCDSLSIIQYMNKNIKDEFLPVKNSGKISLEIIIFDDGRTCCSSITNKTNSEINLDVYRDVVNRMPRWIPIKKDGHATECKIAIVLDINNGIFIDN